MHNFFVLDVMEKGLIIYDATDSRMGQQCRRRLRDCVGLLQKTKVANNDIACFYAQQCAEKYLKARLVQAGILFTKTHDLTALVHLAATVEPLWRGMEPALCKLSSAAVNYRYPGNSASQDEATEAIATAKERRALARQSLGI
jgi:HEPN domain-containing protein